MSEAVPEQIVRRKRVLLVDDHPLVLRGLTQLIDEEDDLTICGAAADCNEALALAARLKPDIALVDLMLEDGEGMDLITALRIVSPNTRVLVFSMLDETCYASQCRSAGANGYLMKTEMPAVILEGIRQVLGCGEFVGKRGTAQRISTPAAVTA